MYITISPQKLGGNYSQSVTDYVSYLGKENQGKTPDHQQYFFNQAEDNIGPERTTAEIDENTAKLKRTEPRYYSITINPSKRELKHIGNNPESLRDYTRQIMKEYAAAFNREINGRPVNIQDIKYFAKIEFHRTFKGLDREIKENAPFLKKIATLQNEIRKVERGDLQGNLESLKNQLARVKEQTPHKIKGKIVEQGTQKPGLQTHVHIIVSRKDNSNSYSLSPGSRYRSSEVVLHGKIVKRGFDRNDFFAIAEKRFDKMFGYNRNFVETYEARKTFIKNPTSYYEHIKSLSVTEKRIAFGILGQTGIIIPSVNLSPHQISFALKQMKRALQIGVRSSSIGY